MYVSLYRRYRPQKFDQLVGQSVAKEILLHALIEGKTAHAYMFSGPRGCGKTTIARLLAKALNCLAPIQGEPCDACESCQAIVQGKHLDVIEIDGASNRGIDEIRELKAHVNLAPFMGRKKIYIIDEVHMLTDAASNALLKTLEEPPGTVTFVLATTESHKVPVTIRSRCQHIPFQRIALTDMVSHLSKVAELEGATAEARALLEIARYADGGLRDALSLLEQALAAGQGVILEASMSRLLGGVSRHDFEILIEQIRSDPPGGMQKIEALLSSGVGAERFLEMLLPLLRDLWMTNLWGRAPLNQETLSEEEISWLEREAPHWSPSVLRNYCERCIAWLPRMRYSIRSEVFSGMLQLLFTQTETDSPQQATAPVVRETERTLATPKKMDAVINTLDTVIFQKPSDEKSDAAIVPLEKSEAPEELHPLLRHFWQDELSLIAALLNATMVRSDCSWEYDLSRITENQRVTLENARNAASVQSAVYKEWALSKDAPPAAAEEALPEAAVSFPMPAPPQRGQDEERRTSFSGGSVEQLAAYLEAEVLYVKPLAVTDNNFESEASVDNQGEFES